MLVQLTLKNFKIFKEETLLDCIPGPINEHKASLIKDPLDGEQFLPVISVYGPNSGGKSTVLYGLSYLSALITAPASASSIPSVPQQLSYRMDPDCAHIPTEFDVLFRHKGFLFRYQLHLLRGVIQEENLFYGRLGKDDAGILFNRKESDFHLGKTVPAVQIEQLPPDRPLLALLFHSLDCGSMTCESVQAAFSWFRDIHFLSPDSPVYPQLPNEPDMQAAICSALQAMDLDITGYRTILRDGIDGRELLITHTPAASASYELPCSEESKGTRKLLSILPDILLSLKEGHLVVADDLDSLLHPHLLRYITSLYTNCEKNPHGSQLIFTSHNTAILMPAVLRRDEIWLCSRPTGEDAQLYPLSWYKKENGLIPRNDEAYGKQYLEGRYGASPKVSY
ncbi:ATP-binding protein [Enterocloster sp. OA13]|uniref:AAA family ATPase n=1 Tax=Enterocloster sp. OA13 TaxID=2914161 RepID=UPI0004727ADA|nr:ATP-binding protein [Enterocloster sp. OA13]